MKTLAEHLEGYALQRGDLVEIGGKIFLYLNDGWLVSPRDYGGWAVHDNVVKFKSVRVLRTDYRVLCHPKFGDQMSCYELKPEPKIKFVSFIGEDTNLTNISMKAGGKIRISDGREIEV